MKDPIRTYDTVEYKNVHENPTIDFPQMLIIQASSYCNFNCLQCSRQVKVEQRKITGVGEGHFKLDLMRKVVDECKDKDSFMGVLFALLGEPLMNNDICDLVRMVKNIGKNTQITTNAFLLDEEMATNLIDAGLDKIKISFTGATETEYKYWRNNSHYHQVMKNALNLISLKKRLKSNFCIQIGTSISNDTPEEVEQFMSFWKSEGADHVYYDVTGMLDIKDKDYVKGKKFRYECGPRTELCSDLFLRLSILHNGDVPFCVLSEEGIRGNLYKQTIQEIWQSEVFEQDRKTILTKGNVFKPCEFCRTPPREATYKG